MRGSLAFVGALAAAAFGLTLGAQQQPSTLFSDVVFREIGPTRQGGRFVDFAVVENMPRVFYAASATGGLYKTENNGLNFTSIFEQQSAPSIGAVAVSQSNPNVVYLGTGEGNNSRSSYWGNGVYVSTDAGKTWTHAGLDESHHIGRIVVHPVDPNTAYVAALGHLYSDNEERGLYKTTDAGKTWTKSLAVKSEGKDVGVVDVAMDPRNPLVLYAASYDKVRRPWTFGEGGPGSAIYKTTDAGKSWTKLGGGLPDGVLGRIGIAISRQDPNTLYAIVENANQQGADAEALKKKLRDGFGSVNGGQGQLYRSDDAGKTWRLVAPTPAPPGPAPTAGRGGRGVFDGGSPAYYYGQVRVDPNDKEHVFVLSVGAQQSSDGGRTWTSLGAGGDNHALWIDPKDGKHLLLGYDHGMGITFDGGQNWHHPDTLPMAQAYAVGFDMATPYNVYTGLQDNGSQKGPSTRKGGGSIPFEDWSSVGGGDGQYNVVEWQDNRYLYNESQFGAIQRTDQWTGQTKNIQYRGAPGKEPVRYNWTAPILVSPHDAGTIYFAGNVVLRSSTRGDTWEEISPDLTVNDPARRGGGGNITYATITTLDESPIVPGLLWAGTDDGNVQVTKDGGKSWTNLRDRIPNHPGYWVSRVEASHLNAATAYVSVTGLRHDDFRPFVWKTTDFGQTWTSIAGNLPKESVNVIREDPWNPQLLFVGTDLGVHVSTDGGTAWTRLKGAEVAQAPAGRGGGRGAAPNAMPRRGLLPAVPVHDVKIHPRDHELIVATHGRGIFIADIAPYEELTPAVMSEDAHLFDIAPVVQWADRDRGTSASTNFAGMSRPNDLAIRYFLKASAPGEVRVRVFDGSRVIAQMTGAGAAGINTVRWDLQAARDRISGEPAPTGRGGRGGFAGASLTPGCDPALVCTPVKPGDYRIVLSVGGRELQKTVRILKDPTLPLDR